VAVDKTTPTEDTVQILFINDPKNGSFTIQKCNGISLEKQLYLNPYKSVSMDDKVRLTVPAGNNSFVFIFAAMNPFGSAKPVTRFGNLEIQYELELGKKYTVAGRREKIDSSSFAYFVGIYDTTNGSELLKEWKLGES
jgi:hypothetical protein